VTAFCHGMGTTSSVMGVSEALKPNGVFIQGPRAGLVGRD
jgi:hypothetical protein